MIHTNERIPSIQKFQYLVISAMQPRSSIELTARNYKVTRRELLKKRYDDLRAIKKKHMSVFTMSKIDKEAANAIRSLVDYVLRHL